MERSLPAGTSVAEVALRVADPERATRFYVDVAGLCELEPGVLGAPGAPVLRLVPAAVWDPAPRGTTGLFHIALLYPTRTALAAALRRAIEAGARLDGASDHGVSEALYLDDPDGNGVELYADRPREAWPAPGAGDRVGIVTLPLDLKELLAAAGQGGGDEAVRVGHVHLRVSDLERSVAFWAGTLGFDVMARWRDQAAFLAAGGYHHHVGLNTWTSRGGGPAPAGAPGIDRVTLAVGDAAAVDVAASRLEAAGAPVAREGGLVVSADPDGIGVALAA